MATASDVRGPCWLLAAALVALPGCGTLNQPTIPRPGQFALGIGTATEIAAPDAPDVDVELDQVFEAFVRFSPLTRLEVFGSVAAADFAAEMGAKVQVLGTPTIGDYHEFGPLIAIDARFGYWNRGVPSSVQEEAETGSAVSATATVPVAFAYNRRGFVYAAPQYRESWGRGVLGLDGREIGGAIGISHAAKRDDDTVIPPVGLELAGLRNLETDTTLLVIRVSLQRWL